MGVTDLHLSYKRFKLKLRVFLTGHNVAMVTYYPQKTFQSKSTIHVPWSLSDAETENKVSPIFFPSVTCSVAGKLLMSGLLSLISKIVISTVVVSWSGLCPWSVTRTVRLYDVLVSLSSFVLLEIVPVFWSIENAFASPPDSKLYDSSEFVPASASERHNRHYKNSFAVLITAVR